MKKLLLPILATALLPLCSAQAAPDKPFGGFEPKTRFILVVVDRESVRTEGSIVKSNARIPKGIPDYRIGENVKFKIGKEGALQLDEARIRFRRGTNRVNYYENRTTSESQKGHVATVTKGSGGKKATGAEITYYSYKTKGLTLITNRVTYKLAK